MGIHSTGYLHGHLEKQVKYKVVWLAARTWPRCARWDWCGGQVLIREVKELKEVNLIYCSRLFSISEAHDIAWLQLLESYFQNLLGMENAHSQHSCPRITNPLLSLPLLQPLLQFLSLCFKPPMSVIWCYGQLFPDNNVGLYSIVWLSSWLRQ